MENKDEKWEHQPSGSPCPLCRPPHPLRVPPHLVLVCTAPDLLQEALRNSSSNSVIHSLCAGHCVYCSPGINSFNLPCLASWELLLCFTHEATEAQSLSDLSKVTPLVGGGSGI